MSERACEIPLCPALAEVGKAFCGPHVDALLAKSLHIAEDKDGRGGKRCIACGRRFKPDDYVLKKMKPKTPKARAPGDLWGHAHVACEPPTPRLSRKKIRESKKPLLEMDAVPAEPEGA